MRIGIDLGGTKIEGIVLDGSREIARRRVPTPRHDYAGTLAAIGALVRDLLAVCGGTGGDSRVPVGLGIPGTVARGTGLVKNANSVWLMGKPLLADLRSTLGTEAIRIHNDANCFAMSEAADGAGNGADVVFAVILGTGTGAGIVANGRLAIGPNGIAGEWGHNPLPWPEPDERPGPLCYCGKHACVETYLSGPGLAADHEARTGRRELPAHIVARAGEGDADAERTLVRYEHRLARALAAVVNVLDPDVIVLGGGLSNIERLYDRVPGLWDRWVFGASPTEPVRTRLVRAKHGAASGVRGAAWLWGTGDAGPG